MKRKKRIFARYGVPKKDILKRRLEFWAKELGNDFNFQVACCVRGIVGDINKSKKIIIRETDRINKAKRAIDIVLELLDEDVVKQTIRSDAFFRIESGI